MHPIDITNVTPFLLSLPIGGIIAAVLTQAIKRAFRMDNDKAIHFLSMVSSGLSSLASYVLAYKGLPPEVLGVSGPAIHGVSQAVYNISKEFSDYLPKVSIALDKPAKVAESVPAPAATQTAPETKADDLDIPDDFLDEPVPATPAAPAKSYEQDEDSF